MEHDDNTALELRKLYLSDKSFNKSNFKKNLEQYNEGDLLRLLTKSSARFDEQLIRVTLNLLSKEKIKELIFHDDVSDELVTQILMMFNETKLLELFNIMSETEAATMLLLTSKRQQEYLIYTMKFTSFNTVYNAMTLFQQEELQSRMSNEFIIILFRSPEYFKDQNKIISFFNLLYDDKKKDVVEILKIDYPGSLEKLKSAGLIVNSGGARKSKKQKRKSNNSKKRKSNNSKKNSRN